MDAARFDGLVRSFSQSRSRRQTLRSLASAVVVGALALGAPEVRADTCKANGKACKKNRQCCTANCVGASRGSPGKSGTCQPYFQGTCTGGERDFCRCEEEGDLCRSGSCTATGPQCACASTAASGAPVCYIVNTSTCEPSNCTSNDDCTSLGAGYVCIRAGTDPATCGCPGTNRNFCARQCNV